jgi:Tfp pilus assembly protein PilF
MDYLSLCLIARDENEYISEWLDYHILIGVERFYVYDNQSQISLRETLADYIHRGWVIVTDITGKAMQLMAYDHCLQTYGNQSKWIGFVDTDEFIIPKATSDLREFLKPYEDYGGLVISSFFFGSSGYIDKPVGGQIVNYRLRTPANSSVNKSTKSIVQPARALFPMSPHGFAYRDGYFGVNEVGWRVDGQNFPHHADKIQLNHYFFRSEKEFREKQKRGRGDSGATYKTGMFDHIHRAATYEDQTALEVIKTVFKKNEVEGWNLEETYKPNAPTLKNMMREQASRFPDRPPISQKGYLVVPRAEIQEYCNLVDTVSKAVEAKDYKTACLIQNQVIEKYPQLIIHYTDISETYFSLGDYQTAYQVLQRASKISPDNFAVQISLGTYYLRTNDFVKAEELCRQILIKAPTEAQVLLGLAWSLINQSRYDEAVGVIYKAIETNRYITGEPGAIDLINLIGVYMYRRGDHTQAMSLFEWALEDNAEDVDLLVNLGKVYYDAKQYSRARETLKAAKKLRPDDEEVNMGLMLVERILGPDMM